MRLLIVALLVFFDFVSKKFIYNNIELNKLISIMPLVDFTHIHNYGISFGFFAGVLSPWFIIFSGVTIMIFLFFWMIRSSNKYEKWGLLFIIAGAISNIGDRLINNFVLDFIFLHYKEYYWPAFNFADIYISMGVFIIIIGSLKTFQTRLMNRNG